MALSLAVMMAVPLTSSGSSKSDTDDGQVPEITNYTDIILGEDFTDLKAEISETLIEYLQNRHHGLVPLQYEHSQNRIKIY